MSDKGMQDWVLKYDPSKAQPQEEIPEDLFIGRDPKEALQLLDKRWEQKLAAEKARWQQELLGQIEEPVKQATALDEAANRWAAENDVPDEVLVAACKEMSETIGRERLDPDIVVRLLPKFANDVVVKIKQEQAAQAMRSQEDTAKKARAASPRGGVGAVAPSDASVDKRIAEKEEELGRRLTVTEKSNIFFDELVRRRGMNERELDEEWVDAKRTAR